MNQCERLLEYGIEYVIQLIEEYETPDVVCGPTQFNFCPARIDLANLLLKKKTALDWRSQKSQEKF